MMNNILLQIKIMATANSGSQAKSYQDRLEKLFFQATNPCNEREDVNIIKQFCDMVAQSSEGPAIAARLLGHKIQSPHDQEALLSLAVLGKLLTPIVQL